MKKYNKLNENAVEYSKSLNKEDFNMIMYHIKSEDEFDRVEAFLLELEFKFGVEYENDIIFLFIRLEEKRTSYATVGNEGDLTTIDNINTYIHSYLEHLSNLNICYIDNYRELVNFLSPISMKKYFKNIKSYESYISEGINQYLKGPTKEEMFKSLGYDRVFDTAEDLLIFFLDGIKIKPQTKYTDSIFWEKDGKILIEQKLITQIVFVDFDIIWKPIITIFNLSFREMHIILKNILKEQLNIPSSFEPTWKHFNLWKDSEKFNEGINQYLKGPNMEEVLNNLIQLNDPYKMLLKSISMDFDTGINYVLVNNPGDIKLDKLAKRYENYKKWFSDKMKLTTVVDDNVVTRNGVDLTDTIFYINNYFNYIYLQVSSYGYFYNYDVFYDYISNSSSYNWKECEYIMKGLTKYYFNEAPSFITFTTFEDYKLN